MRRPRQAAPNPQIVGAEQRMLPKFEGKPVLPYGWDCVALQGRSRDDFVGRDAGRKAIRVQSAQRRVGPAGAAIRGGRSRRMYNFGLCVKGSGRVDLVVWAAEPAPDEMLARPGSTPGRSGRRSTARKKVGPHRHLARFMHCNHRPGGRDDPAGGSVRANRRAGDRANPLLVKPAKDADTIFYEDFDGPTPGDQVECGARLTDKDGGRFGRGLITSAKDGGSITQPVAGRAAAARHDRVLVQARGLARRQRRRTFPWPSRRRPRACRKRRLNFIQRLLGREDGFRVPPGMDYDRATAENAGWGWWQPGTWHHIAGSWDGDVMRVYVDGVLEGVCYGKDKMFPRGKAVDLFLPLDGVIDEIRISKGLRYGPIVPDGVKPVLYSLATTSQPPPAAARQGGQGRGTGQGAGRSCISPVPQSTADYTFGVDQVRPAWEGMSGMKVQKDYFGKGRGRHRGPDPTGTPGHAMYWRIEKIEPGDYYVGLWAETANPQMRTEYGVDKLLASAYLNGWPLRFATTTDPVQVRPGVWLAELQTASPVTFKDGDEIAVWPVRQAEQAVFPASGPVPQGTRPRPRGDGADVRRGLRQSAASPPGAVAGNQGQRRRRDQARSENRGRQSAAVRDRRPSDLEAGGLLRRAAGGADRARAPGAAHGHGHQPTVHGLRRRARLPVGRQNASRAGLQVPVPRPVEMLDLSDYSRWEFQPNQPDPLTVWNHVRKDLKDNRTGERKVLCLDGNDWQWAYLDGRRVPATVPAGLAYSRGTVPFMEYWIKLPPAGLANGSASRSSFPLG